MYDFSDKVVVVTGGASGIGKSIVKAFGRAGATVIFADHNISLGSVTEREIRHEAENENVIFIEADLSSEEDITQFANFVLDNYKKVDVIVNNVGVNFNDGKVTEVEMNDYIKTYQINVFGLISLIKKFLPAMLDRKSGGSILNISSTMSIGSSGVTAYSSSKGSINSLTKSLALDYAKDGIRVNAIAPGVIDTPAIQPWLQQQEDPAKSKGIPMGEIGKPEDVANAALFLASDMAVYITGHVLVVDGGLTVGE